MVKRREPPVSAANARPQPTAAQIEAFASKADGGAGVLIPEQKLELDQNANRDYKAMRVPFNQYEHEQLEIGAKLSGRTKLNFMRYAMLKLAKELQDEQAQ
ncbi:MAG: hypothetical protein RLZ92_1313 [Pseudomonadota bacterium]|jgi:hypothetical protein